jgi:hypothetical protein
MTVRNKEILIEQPNRGQRKPIFGSRPECLIEQHAMLTEAETLLPNDAYEPTYKTPL